MSDAKSSIEKVKDTVTDKEAPIGKQVPEAPFAIAGLTYLVILGVAMVLLGFLLWLFS